MHLLRNLLFWIVLALLGAVLAHFLFAQDPGYVLVRWRGSDYTTTVLYASWIVLGVALALWIAWSLLTWPFRAWSLHRDQRQRARIGEGFVALHEGRYARAGTLLTEAADDPPAPPDEPVAP
jgi:HemY protein